MNRIDAAKAGFTRYNTGKVCRGGHMADRYVSTGNCVACLAASRKSLVQMRNSAAQGWPKVETSVPRDQLDLLRVIVDMMRRGGEHGRRCRYALRQSVHDIRVDDDTPITESLIVSGGFEPAPVRSLLEQARADVEDEDGEPGWSGDEAREGLDDGRWALEDPPAPDPLAALPTWARGNPDA